MKPFLDVIVVGGGPCGSFNGLNLGKLGAKVAVFEEHNEIGIPSHGAGHLSINGLKKLGLFPLPEKIVENVFYGANFYSPIGTNFSVRFPSPVTCAVNRVLFDKYIAEKAEAANVHYHLNSRVESLLIKNEVVKGIEFKQSNGNKKKFSAKIIIDAEGISSRILRKTGLSPLNSNRLVYAVQVEVENVKDVEPDVIEVFLGRNYVPGFYAWLIPKHDINAKVGLAARAGNPKELLQKLMRKHPVASKQLRKAKIIQTSFHPITLGGPIPRTYSNGFLVVGDAASQVKPTTGGGIIFGMICAKIAAEVADKALRQNDFSSELLSSYQRLYEEALGFDFSVMLKIRKILDAISDKKIHKAIRFCTKIRLDKTLQNIKEIDFQGQAILKFVRNPRILAFLIYFFFLYLPMNPQNLWRANYLKRLQSV